jgi:hypothetical protein
MKPGNNIWKIIKLNTRFFPLYLNFEIAYPINAEVKTTEKVMVNAINILFKRALIKGLSIRVAVSNIN